VNYSSAARSGEPIVSDRYTFDPIVQVSHVFFFTCFLIWGLGQISKNFYKYAFGRNAANQKGQSSYQCGATLFPDLPRMTRGKLGCQCVRTLLEGTPKDKGN